MGILRGLVRQLGYRALRRGRDAHRPVRVMRSFEEVESIGMVVPGDDEGTFNQLLDYAYSLRQGQQKRVFVCTFYERKQLPPYLSARRDVTLLRVSDLNWLHRPISLASRAFCEEHFDYLLDFTREPNLPLEWVVQLSHAILRVGFRSVESVDIHFALPASAGIREQVEVLDRYLNRP